MAKSVESKKCVECNIEQALENFNKVKPFKLKKDPSKYPDGRYHLCKTCGHAKYYRGSAGRPSYESLGIAPKRYTDAGELLEDLNYDPLYEGVRMSEEIARRIELEESQEKPSAAALNRFRDTQFKLLQSLSRYKYSPKTPDKSDIDIKLPQVKLDISESTESFKSPRVSSPSLIVRHKSDKS